MVIKPMSSSQIRARIRAHWAELALQFRSDGQLWAKPRRPGASWGVLLTRSRLERLFLHYRS